MELVVAEAGPLLSFSSCTNEDISLGDGAINELSRRGTLKMGWWSFNRLMQVQCLAKHCSRKTTSKMKVTFTMNRGHAKPAVHLHDGVQTLFQLLDFGAMPGKNLVKKTHGQKMFRIFARAENK